MPTPEALARQIIDQKLTAAGWIVQDFKALNLGAGPGVAVREFQIQKACAKRMDSVLKSAFEGRLV